MTYSLFEFAKERAGELIVNVSEEQSGKMDPAVSGYCLLHYDFNDTIRVIKLAELDQN